MRCVYKQKGGNMIETNEEMKNRLRIFGILERVLDEWPYGGIGYNGLGKLDRWDREKTGTIHL